MCAAQGGKNARSHFDRKIGGWRHVDRLRLGFAHRRAAAQQKASPPDFSSNNAGWLTFYTDFSMVPGGTGPMHDDPAHPRLSNQEAARTGKQPTYFIADPANNTILKL
jgi:hypothetical protein